MQSVRQMLMSFCAYTHLWRVIKHAIVERRLPDSIRQGALIALLGFFCPFFWLALLMGASKAELIFHATHSGVVFCLGVLLMLKTLSDERQAKLAKQ